MITAQLNDLELEEGWLENEPPKGWRATTPLSGVPEITSLGAVYFELEPGETLVTHCDREDEIVVLLSGSGEAKVGDETRNVDTHGIVFIPAMLPHGISNTGSETLRAFGVFAGPDFEGEIVEGG